MSFLQLFKGGIHIPDGKDLSMHIPVANNLPCKTLTVPLLQHIGSPASAIVESGQHITMGEMLGTASGPMSASIHSPVSGTVSGIASIILPNGKNSPAVIIENDFKEQWNPSVLPLDIKQLTSGQMIQRVSEAGVVGMGGAGFPTAAKLTVPAEKNIDIVIINGTECEPFLTGDYRLLLERPQDIVSGLKIIMTIMGAKRGFIAIENNKPLAIKALRDILGASDVLSVASLPVRYPQGSEKMLIKTITKREVPSRRLPSDVGVMVQNAATTIAIYEAVALGKPLIERVVTVSGDAIANPSNIRVKIGTPLSHVISQCGGITKEAVKVILGGPMMGTAVPSLDFPVTKTTSAILVFSEQKAAQSLEHDACFRCGKCIEACPLGLEPGTMGTLAEKERFEDAKARNISECMECGCCAYVCPAKRPIVQQIRYGKSQLKP